MPHIAVVNRTPLCQFGVRHLVAQGLSLAELEEALLEVYEIRQEEKQRLAAIRKTGKLRIPA